MTSFTYNDFADLLGEQAELIKTLLAIGQNQLTAIQAGHMSQLMELLAKKQPHLDRLSELRQQLHLHRASIERETFWPDQATRSCCRDLRQQASAAFDELIELEQQCEAAMVTSRQEIQSRLSQLDSGIAAARAYQSNAYDQHSPHAPNRSHVLDQTYAGHSTYAANSPASQTARRDFSSLG